MLTASNIITMKNLLQQGAKGFKRASISQEITLGFVPLWVLEIL